MIPFDLTGQSAIVTGGASGIGHAAAQRLAAAGATVTVFDRISAPGLSTVLVDLADPTATAQAFASLPAPDILIANAGTGRTAPLDETTDDLWEQTLALNLSGVFRALRAVTPGMKARGSGSIVLTASTNSFDGEANLVAYNASKAGLLGILHTAANELGPFGIRVNAVCPGMIETPLTRSNFADENFIRPYFREIALGRGGQPDEVAAAIVFLASPWASYITGATLLVDGGQMAAKFGTWKEPSARFTKGRWMRQP